MKSDLHMRAWAIERRFLRRLISRARAQKTDLAGALALIYPGDEESEEAGGGYDVISGVAVIQVTGVIWEGCPDLYKRLGYATDPTDVREAVRKAADDAAVRSIYLHVDSPGGYIDGVDELADAIYETRAVKPIHAHIANLGASAGYEIACNAHTITANRRATVGSIGTYLVIDDWSQFYQEAGVITHVVSSGPYKGTGVIGAEVTDEQLAWLQEEVNDLAEQFVATVARGRGMTIARATELATGRTWIAGQAVDLGLIDAVATEEEAFAAVIDEGPDTSEIQTGKEHG
ncbi:MAG: signal peptide peptidase SppA, partial [Armatimonadota bacterium]